MELKHALRVKEPLYAAIVGAGGKTTALFRLARQLAAPVLVSTSTHLGVDQAALADQHFILQQGEMLALPSSLKEEVMLWTGAPGDDQRLHGLQPEQLNDLFRAARARGCSLLVEADGSRGLPVKAPAAHEPVIPAWTELVVVCAGLSALGKALDGDTVHRPELFALLSGGTPQEPISADLLAAVLKHPEGGLKNIPDGSRRVALLNQADTPSRQSQAFGVASQLLPDYHAVLIASLRDPALEVVSVHEQVAGIILAAGGSTRFGQPKILLDWGGKPFIRREAEAALAAGLSPVIVVLGSVREPAVQALEGLPVQVVFNDAWREGQGRSVAVGAAALPKKTGAAIFLLGDQPQVTPAVLQALVEEHRRGLAQVIAPLVDGKRANPVLFDRVTFPDLRQLQGDAGGRSLFSRYRVQWMPWLDHALLLDVDTPEDYDRLMGENRI